MRNDRQRIVSAHAEVLVRDRLHRHRGDSVGDIRAEVLGEYLPRVGDLVHAFDVLPLAVHDRFAKTELMADPDLGALVDDLHVTEVQHVPPLLRHDRQQSAVGTTVVCKQQDPGLVKRR